MRKQPDEVTITTNTGVALASLALVAVGLGSAWYAFSNVVPATTMRWWGGYVAALIIAFVAVIIAFELTPRSVRRARRRSWRLAGEVLHWGTWLAVQGVIWLLMPWGTEPMQLVTVLFSTGYIAANYVTSIDSPGLARLRVGSVAISLVLATLVHRVTLWPYIAGYLLCFGMVMLMVGNIIDRSIGQLRAARVEAEAARDARTHFMAAASHDLGQPLQAARLFFEQAIGAPDGPRQEVAARNTRIALAAMERLVRQMLDHLRLDQGAVETDLRRFRVADVIAAVAAQFEPLAALGQIDLRAVSGTLDICGDPELVERALGNLVDNALRHSRGARILIGARRHGPRVRIWVIDNGCGIPGGDVGKLFEPFVQGSGDGRPRGGLGIGLSSVRALMTLMQGSSGIDLRWDKGAAFYLELPA
ncbi:sensor histidine kinase [Sphingomonas antarctica]|uniref:sensor histidine kinase n=1 Tax=Sphingomonas antarctica TaxID=2040274 RepID=UPI0039EAB336